ncbi:hypothetical protein H9P43_004232 [Blastocladiella emersonii ATCC 22665]|nr:hypothetical protein H9P43_004232 [Blastocladiella emersonii ATCC 22665]
MSLFHILAEDRIDRFLMLSKVILKRFKAHSARVLPLILPFVADSASSQGRLDLKWWYTFFPNRFIYSEYALDWASKHGRTETVRWWLYESELPPKYTAAAVDETSRLGHVEVLKLWFASGLPVKFTERAGHNFFEPVPTGFNAQFAPAAFPQQPRGTGGGQPPMGSMRPAPGMGSTDSLNKPGASRFPTLADLFQLCLPSGTLPVMLRINFYLAGLAAAVNTVAFACMWWTRVPGFGMDARAFLRATMHLLAVPLAYIGWYKPGLNIAAAGGVFASNRFDAHTYLLLHSLHALYAVYMAVGVPGSGSAGAIWWEAHFSMGHPGVATINMFAALAWGMLGLVSMGIYLRMRRM